MVITVGAEGSTGLLFGIAMSLEAGRVVLVLDLSPSPQAAASVAARMNAAMRILPPMDVMLVRRLSMGGGTHGDKWISVWDNQTYPRG